MLDEYLSQVRVRKLVGINPSVERRGAAPGAQWFGPDSHPQEPTVRLQRCQVRLPARSPLVRVFPVLSLPSFLVSPCEQRPLVPGKKKKKVDMVSTGCTQLNTEK